MNIVAAGKLEDILPATSRWPMNMSNVADERFLYSTRETKVPYELKRQMQISNLPYFAKKICKTAACSVLFIGSDILCGTDRDFLSDSEFVLSEV